MKVRISISMVALVGMAITLACSSSSSGVHCCLSADKTSCRCNGKGQPNEAGCDQSTEVGECTPSVVAPGSANYCCNRGTSCDCATAASGTVACSSGTSVSSCSASTLAGGASGSSGTTGSSGTSGVCRVGEKSCSPTGAACPCGTSCVKHCATCDYVCDVACQTDSNCASVGAADGTPWKCRQKVGTTGPWCWF